MDPKAEETAGIVEQCGAIGAQATDVAFRAAKEALKLPGRVAKTAVNTTIDVLPAGAAEHFVNSGREFLLAIRSLFDRELEHTEHLASRVQERMREKGESHT